MTYVYGIMDGEVVGRHRAIGLLDESVFNVI
jgi:hypothetical protein